MPRYHKSLKLTEREAQVYLRIIQGMRNRSIAKDLNVTEKTVKWHATKIYEKCFVKSRTQLIIAHFKTKAAM